MRLSDLNPSFYDAHDGRKGIGILCDCPCGSCDSLLAIPFDRPLDGEPPLDSTTWKRTGDTFETLTLAPSVHRLSGCKWHGFIRDGGIITV